MHHYDINEESVTIQNIELPDISAVAEKITKYEAFVNDVLKNDLKYVLEERDKVYDDIAEYAKLQTTIERLQTVKKVPIKSKIDVGCNFYMEAQVKNTQYIFVDIGMGLHVQMTFSEALNFLSKKIDQLTAKAESFTDKSVDIKARIKLILEALAELQGLNVKEKQPHREVFY